MLPNLGPLISLRNVKIAGILELLFFLPQTCSYKEIFTGVLTLCNEDNRPKF